MEKMIIELRELQMVQTSENCKKFIKLYNKAAKLYADFYGRSIAEGFLYVKAQLA